MAIEKSTEEQERLDLLGGKLNSYRTGRMPTDEHNQLYDQIIDLTAQVMIDRRGKEAYAMCFSIASGMDSLGLANQRFTAKVSGDVVSKIAEIAYQLKHPSE